MFVVRILKGEIFPSVSANLLYKGVSVRGRKVLLKKRKYLALSRSRHLWKNIGNECAAMRFKASVLLKPPTNLKNSRRSSPANSDQRGYPSHLLAPAPTQSTSGRFES